MHSLPTPAEARASVIPLYLSPFTGALAANASVAPDWHELWRFCSFHGVRPALAAVAEWRASTQLIPSWLSASLFTFSKDHAFSVLQKTSEIVRLSQALEAEQIPAVFFKGAALAEQVYGGVDRREFNDIDLLVDPAARDLAVDLLEALGYAPVIADARFRHAFFDYAGQHMFRHGETGTVVDLHWNFAGLADFPASVEDVLANRTLLSVGGTQVPVPCLQDLALILVGHGQKEGWASFGWALDFATFAARFPHFDWSQAARLAEAGGCRRAILTAALLVERLFGQSIGTDLSTEAARNPEINGNVERIVQGYHGLAERRLEDDLMGALRLCETRRQRARVWWDLLTTRTIGDYEAMPLPAGLWWLYRFTRPFRLIWQRLRRQTPAPSAYFEQRRAGR